MDVDESYEIQHISLHGVTKTDKWVWSGEDLTIHKIPKEYDSHPPHYRPTIILEMLKDLFTGVDYVAVEDYAFGAKGKVFDIAECSGALKNFFYSQKIPMKKFPPMTVKLCAAGSGTADKVLMGMAFKESRLAKMVNQHIFELPEYDNPQEDLIDAIYMANVLRLELCYRANGAFPANLYMPEMNCLTAIVKGKPGAKTQPSIEHPIITFGEFSRPKKKKKEKKVKKEKPEKLIKEASKVKAPKKKLEVPKK